MNALEERIIRDAKVLGTDIIKVDMFLNHRIDTGLLFEMGKLWGEEFESEHPDLVLTVEASGIAMAIATAGSLRNIPVVFAKKSATVVQNDEMYYAPVYSFTHKTMNNIRVEKSYIPEGSRVLIIDDFLANGEATKGMISLCRQAGATVVGIGIAVEKGFQEGGRELRAQGLHVKSLAVIDAVEDGKVILRHQ